jgi:hypothetical protein
VRLIVFVLASAATLVAAGRASAESFGCGLPETQPLRIEFADGSVEFRQQLFGKPGVVVATNGVERAAEMRSLGAHTVYWHMGLRQLTGMPQTPKDPVETEQRANALFDRAVASSGCETPVIVLNELNGWYAPTPWPSSIAQYRANVLLVMRVLAGRGAKPFLLVPGPARGSKTPNVAGDAAQWWREVAAAGYIIRELYFNAPYIYNRGPVVGPRLRRTAMRQGISQLTGIGIPVNRLGIILGFHSGPGKGGREGLQPSAAWFEVIKREALAARQVAAELGFSTILSWGWATFSFAPEGADPDKAAAACVYLWAHDQSLCDGPAAAGPDFGASLSEGQIILPAGVHCAVGEGQITTETVELLETMLGDRPLALRAALQRLILARSTGEVTDADVRAAERAAVAQAFGGDQDAYLKELAGRGIARASALDALADILLSREAAVLLAFADPDLPWPNWVRRQQRAALVEAICLGDEVPTSGPFDWADSLPFLALPEASVSLESTARVLRVGQPVTLSGSVSSPRATEVVNVYALDRGSTIWRLVAEAPVSREGDWTLEVTLRFVGITKFRAGSRTALSDVVGVRVRRRGGPQPPDDSVGS